MRISPIYADRTDLSAFSKARFSLEDSIGQNKHVQTFCRWCARHTRLRDAIELSSILFGMPVLVIVGGTVALARKVAGDDFGDKAEWVGVSVGVALIGVITYLAPFGWVLAALGVQFVLAMEFMVVSKRVEELLN